MGCGASSDVSTHDLVAELQRRVDEDPTTLSSDDAAVLKALHQRVVPRDRTYVLADSRLVDGGSPIVSGLEPPTTVSFNDVTISWDRATELCGIVEVGDRIVSKVLRKEPGRIVAFASLAESQRGSGMARMINEVARMSLSGPTFVSSLLSLGARHSCYGVDDTLIALVKVSTMEVLSEIGEGLSPDETAAWETMWETVVSLMAHGVQSPLGQRNATRFAEATAQDVQTLWQKIRLAQADADEKLFSRRMYKRVLERFPELSRFSNLTDFRTAERIMAMLTTIVDNRAEGRDNVAMMRESGARHVAYNTTMEDMECFLPAFLDTCEYYLGDDFTDVASCKLEELFRYIMRGFEVGMMGYANEDANEAPQSPDGIAMVFTDIEKSTRLWELNPQSMSQALEKHNTVVRQLIQLYRGYEVKAIGDSFMVAFASIVDAVLFSCSIQTELMLTAPIAPGFRMVRTDLQGGGPASVWDERTLRVRVGIEWCQQYSAQYDPVHRRYDYFGPSINVAARVEGNAAGGQVLMTGAAHDRFVHSEEYVSGTGPFEFEELKANGMGSPPTLRDALSISLEAEHVKLKGVLDGVDLYSAVPMCLKGRAFDTAQRLRREVEFKPQLDTGLRSQSTRPRSRSSSYAGNLLTPRMSQ